MADINFRERMTPIWAILERLNIEEVAVTYAGSGDSGQAEDVNWIARDDDKLAEDVLKTITVSRMESTSEWNPDTKDWQPTKKMVEVSVEAELLEIAEYAVYANWAGWENNEGGFGTVYFRIEDYSIDVSHHYYITHQETASIDATPSVLEQMAILGESDESKEDDNASR